MTNEVDGMKPEDYSVDNYACFKRMLKTALFD